MTRYIPYTLPVWVTLTFVAACHAEQYWAGVVLLPVVTAFNAVLGKFSLQELLKEYRFFHHSPGMEVFRGLSALFFTGFNAWAAWFLADHVLLWWQILLFIYGVIMLNSNFAISLAHDLMHSDHALNRFFAGVLLLVNGFFYLETDHIYIHHKHVGTQEDPASAKRNEPLYAYLPRSVSGRLKLLFGNELRYRNGIRLLICGLLLLVAYTISLPYFVCLLAQFIFVTLLYEVITYIQHYGLRRTGPEVRIHHAWNCYYRLSAYMHYMMPVHSIHHLKQEPDLDSVSDAGPAYPMPFSRMVILALFPKAWIPAMEEPLENVRKSYEVT